MSRCCSWRFSYSKGHIHLPLFGWKTHCDYGRIMGAIYLSRELSSTLENTFPKPRKKRNPTTVVTKSPWDPSWTGTKVFHLSSLEEPERVHDGRQAVLDWPQFHHTFVKAMIYSVISSLPVFIFLDVTASAKPGGMSLSSMRGYWVKVSMTH